jgi:U3 small nucleolar RNA-associated protein 13
VRLWRLPGLAPGLVLRGHKRGVWAVAFSPVEQVLASGSGDRTVRLWSAVDGACLRTLEGHGGSVLRTAFATAGTQARAGTRWRLPQCGDKGCVAGPGFVGLGRGGCS